MDTLARPPEEVATLILSLCVSLVLISYLTSFQTTGTPYNY